MNKKLENNLKNGQIILYLVPTKKYASEIGNILSTGGEMFKKICYVSLNKPYTTLIKILNEKSIDTKKFIFVDAVSGKVGKQDDVFFVSSPRALTDLGITMSKVLKKDIDIILFDSLSTLLIYEESSTVIKFSHSIISKSRETDKKCIFISMKEDMKTGMMKDLNMIVDKIVG
jgi:archaellum biogenesis ATPase FlaH